MTMRPPLLDAVPESGPTRSDPDTRYGIALKHLREGLKELDSRRLQEALDIFVALRNGLSAGEREGLGLVSLLIAKCHQGLGAIEATSALASFSARSPLAGYAIKLSTELHQP